MELTKNIKRTAALLLAASAMTGCDQPDFVDTTVHYDVKLAASELEPTGTSVDTRFTETMTNFSETLFRECTVPGKNLVLSPLSVTYALTLAANGAEGETLGEFNALNSSIDVVEMNEYLYAITKRMEETAESTVRVANSLWAREGGFYLNQEFVRVGQKYYDASASVLDFSSPDTIKTINRWVSTQTDGMIEEAVEKIDPMTVLILINTVLFDGIWVDIYEEHNVWEQNFTGYGGTTAPVDFLHSTEHTYFEVENGVGFRKAYKDGYDFVAILPNEGIDVYDFVSTLDIGDTVATASKGSKQVICSLPKFEYESEVDLVPILKSMGLERAFSVSDAEFAGIGYAEAGNIYVSDVLQKAKIKLDEQGTKAAAMTEVMMMCGSAMMTEPPKEIVLDRPFVYLITDTTTGLPLFMGVLAEVN